MDHVWPTPSAALAARPAPSRRRLLAIAALIGLALFCFVALRAESAQADSCHATGGQWQCGWEQPNLAPNTPRWFEAANTLRNWLFAVVWDGYGGTVTQKCVHIMRGSDGYKEQVACGSGRPENYVPEYMRPGYMFIRHGASGPRTLGGGAYSP